MPHGRPDSPGRTLSIRQSVLRSLLVLVLVLSGAILIATYFAAERAVESLSRAAMQTALAKVESDLRGFFQPVQNGLEVARAWGAAGLLDLDQPDLLTEAFAPFLAMQPQMSAIMVADERGREYLLLHRGDDWLVRVTRRDEWGNRSRQLAWSESQPERRESWHELDYDPRKRPWYLGALSTEGDPKRPRANPYWTEPYTFFTTREPGMTAATRFDAGDGIQRVVAIDVLLKDLSRFTLDLQVRQRGIAAVLSEDERVLGLPRSPHYEHPDARRAALLQNVKDLALPVIADARRATEAAGRPVGVAVRFESGGETWWGERADFVVAPGRRLWIAAVVPQADLVGLLARLQLAIGALTAVALPVAFVQALLLARRMSRPIEALAAQSERIGRGDLAPGEPIASPIREVRRLAEAHEHMRVALGSLLEIERDLAVAREIQQSTLPDELPRLPGFELAACSEPADQTGGDAYDAVALGPGRAVLLLADATGHGIGPALSVTQLRAMLRMALRSGEPLEQIAHHLNAQLREDLTRGRFITAWLAELDAGAGTLRQWSAGQAPILRFDAARGEVEERPADAPPLGVLDELDVAIAAPLALAPGDFVLVLSDGILEGENAAGEHFGGERVAAVLRSVAREPAAEILAALQAELAAFTAGHPAIDDRTALLVKRSGA